MKYLFIGGCLDGQRIETNGEAEWFVATVTDGGPAISLRNRYSHTRERYVLSEFADRDNHHIYVYLTEGETSPMRRLIEGYRPGEALAVEPFYGYPDGVGCRLADADGERALELLGSRYFRQPALLVLRSPPSQ